MSKLRSRLRVGGIGLEVGELGLGAGLQWPPRRRARAMNDEGEGTNCGVRTNVWINNDPTVKC